MKLTNKAYDVMKCIVSCIVPALITLILGLGQIVEFPSELIAGILGLVNTFLGTVLGISSNHYWEDVQG